MAQSSSTSGPTIEAQIEDAGPSRKKIQLTVPAQVVDRRFKETYEKAGKNIRLPGFRPGHVPRSVIEQRFGDALVQEVTEHVVNRALDEVAKANNLVAIGEIKLDLEDRSVERGQEFSFEFEMDLRPMPEVENYQGLRVDSPPIEVDEDEVEEQLGQLCEQTAELQKIEDENEGLTETGSFNAHVVFHCDGEAIHEIEQVRLFAARPIKGCDEQTYKNSIAGAKVGQQVRIPLTFREGFSVEEAIGKEGEAEINVLETYRMVIPTPEQLAERAGMEDVDAVKAEVRRQIEAGKKQQRDQEIDRQILEQLLRNTEMELPEKLVADEVADRLEKAKQELIEQGAEEPKAAAQAAENLPAIESGVREFWKALFLKETIGREQKIGVNEKEVRHEIEMIAMRNQSDPQEVWNYYSENKLMGVLRHDLHDRKVRAFLRDSSSANDGDGSESEADSAADPS